jgi:signal transduction histidine kinase
MFNPLQCRNNAGSCNGDIAIDLMVASFAHELKQPLAAMVANADATRRWLSHTPPNIEEAKASLDNIANEGHRASEVINSIRSMYKKGTHGRTLLNPNDVIRATLAMVHADLLIQRVSTSIELREDLPRVMAERGQLQQVLLNLITNAIEAMHDITNRPRILRVRSDINEYAACVRITVEDTGIGIDDKDTEHFFEPFFTTKSTGTGIGLSLCRSIIEAHGGTIHVSANRPHGTIFSLNFPLGRVTKVRTERDVKARKRCHSPSRVRSHGSAALASDRSRPLAGTLIA